MSILIANIGTSDLAVKIEDYYFPIKFDRNEPNIKLPPANSNEAALWTQRESFIQEFLCDELKLNNNASFRDLTHQILENYQQNPEQWHSRLRPGRIWGIIKTAQEKFHVKHVYYFVTDQPPTEVSGYPTDTINLAKILNIWLKREILDLQITPIIIPQNIKPVEQDALFNYYYEQLQKISQGQDKILISLKGGTPQMQIALRIQVMALSVDFQAYLEPELDIVKVLAGKASPCKLNAYWLYIRGQKYQAINQILQRWDFDGSIQLMRSYQEYLQSLIQENVIDVSTVNDDLIEQVIIALNVAVDCFNLDNFKASQDLKKAENKYLRQSSNLHKLICDDNYDRLLNIYTQCRIFWQLNQIAHFLSRLASFGEEVLHDIIKELGGLKYFDKINYPDDWYVNKKQVESQLWQIFEKKEGKKSNEKSLYRLPGRFSKWNFVDALINYRNDIVEKTAWQKITESLDRLDYWIDKRNQIIHSSQGVSLESMVKILEKDRKYKIKYANQACSPTEILTEITTISQQTARIFNNPVSHYVGLNSPYYIYSDVRDWVLTQLTQDGLH
ncbi:hypothetical protein [Nostoc sp. UHCC 0870]|uniref:hypothetical protein n=1 Tax=Nostoc sp. UHCC 0870 TaxID=2914041 RepID=UPI001EE06C74|nr:hypothetical protein [Nostoc sp. UHCC 0870]UKP01086.1 hypothetical protein L6494_27390 [Nostoc sp. UHCC 0870]